MLVIFGVASISEEGRR